MKKFTSKKQQQVQEFHLAFNHPTENSPTVIDYDRAINRSIWTGEEIIEFLHASSSSKQEFTSAYYSFLEGLRKAYFKSYEVEVPSNDLERVIAQADALTDQEYFINGSFVELGVDSEKIFDIVQSANMSKLFTDEKGNKYAKYREEDGKILKSPEFFSPEEFIEKEILAQMLEEDLQINKVEEKKKSSKSIKNKLTKELTDTTDSLN